MKRTKHEAFNPMCSICVANRHERRMGWLRIVRALSYLAAYSAVVAVAAWVWWSR